MANMTTLELAQYYPGLLIIQYLGKPRASAQVQATITPMLMPQTSTQEISFSLPPTSGAFVLSYDEVATASINWNDDETTIQGKLQAITALATVTVSGSIATSLVVTFTDVPAPALSLVVDSSTLLSTATPVTLAVAETDLILTLAIQDAFNLVPGTGIAQGVHLDVIGEYVGASRTGRGINRQITLDDSDYLSLIQMAILKNSAGSSLATIQQFIQMFFPGQMLVFDYQDMSMSYFIASTIGSPDLLEMFISQGLLPKPMAVQINVIIYAPTINDFFGFRTYNAPAFNASPFNSYADYHMDFPWLSYSYAVPI